MRVVRSPQSLIRFDLPFKPLPDVDRLRPEACAGCGLPRGQPGALGLHGHGIRSRQQRGPGGFGEKPTITEVVIRRYICTACGAITTVTPPLVRRKLFSPLAIAWALALYGLLDAAPRHIRALISPWRIVGAGAAHTWRSVGRWAAEAEQLFATPAPGPDATLRARAHRAAMALCARAGPSTRDLPPDHRAAIGATQRP